MRFVAVVTGASSGIGEAAARAIADQLEDAHLVLVARRKERLELLAAELGRERVTTIAADLTDAAAPRQIARTIQNQFGALHLLVNNAGARWSLPFVEGGYANVEQTMRINFDAQVRLTEALLPSMLETAAVIGSTPATPMIRSGHKGGALRGATKHQRPGEEFAPVPAPVSIVNVASTSGRVARPGAAAYSASKFALIGWSEGIAAELAASGVHVGLVNPGFIATEGFPAAELRAKRLGRYIVSTPEKAAAAIIAAGPGGKPEVYVPGFYWLAAAARILAPSLVRRSVAKGTFTTATHSNP
jgi:uncharacterized protein